MRKPSRFHSPAAALIRHLAVRNIPHSARYIFPDEDQPLIAAQLVFEQGQTWLATINYRKPWDSQVSASPSIGFDFSYANPQL